MSLESFDKLEKDRVRRDTLPGVPLLRKLKRLINTPVNLSLRPVSTSFYRLLVMSKLKSESLAVSS